MFRFKNLTVKTKIYFLVAVFIVGLLTFGTFSYLTLEEVKINGPIYRQIVQGKDLVADILPPPEYIIESHLLVQQMATKSDTTELEDLIQRSQRLKEEYDTRHEFWIQDLEEGKMKDAMIVRAYQPAIEYFEIRDKQFIPAVRAVTWKRPVPWPMAFSIKNMTPTEQWLMN